MTDPLWVNFAYEADLLRKGNQREYCWLAEPMPVAFEAIDAHRAPIALTATVAGNRLDWREFDGRLFRPIVAPEGDLVGRIEHLAYCGPDVTVRTDPSDTSWPDFPLVVDARFVPQKPYRRSVYQRATVEADTNRPVKEWVHPERDRRLAEFQRRTRDVLVIDGVPHRAAPEPVIRLSIDPPAGIAKLEHLAPPMFPQPAFGMQLSVFFRITEEAAARETLHALRTDPFLTETLLGDRVVGQDLLSEVTMMTEWPASLDPDQLTIEDYAIYNQRWIRGNLISDMPVPAIIAYAHARQIHEEHDFRPERLSQALDALSDCQSLVADRGNLREAVYGRLVHLQRIARANNPESSADLEVLAGVRL